MTYRDTPSPSTPTADELRTALSDRTCRFVVHYLSDAAESDASVAELSTTVARRDDSDEARIAVRLHHDALPRLSSVGVVDYDAERKTVRYPGHSHLENRLRIRRSDPEYAVEVR